MRTSDEKPRIGFRIEFWERPDDDRDPGDLAGGAYIEDAFLSAAVPRAGELVASQVVTGYGSHPVVPTPQWLPVPFLRVRQVEHYPAQPALPGGTPPGGMGIMVVIRVKTPKGKEAWRDAKRLLTERGWTADWFDLESDTAAP